MVIESENELLETFKSERFRLSYHTWSKRLFDPSSKKDLKDYHFFLKNQRWEVNCPFILEWPHLTITDMIRTKIIDHYIDKMVKDAK